jgi:hypothetical protein
VFENTVLRRIFGPKKDEVTGEWRKLHSEELHNFHLPPDIIRQIKSRKMMQAVRVERIGQQRNMYSIMLGKPKRKRTTRKTKA